MTGKDLRVVEPAPFGSVLDGYAYIPRMLDKEGVEDELQGPGFYVRVRDANRVFEGAEHGAGVTVELVEAEPGDAQETHAHPLEEVVVVVDGAATYFLGAEQARIVRAGQIVRIPAGISHRYENRSPEHVRAVVAHGWPELAVLSA